MNPLFPPLPEDLTALTDEELAEALSAHLSAVQRIKANDVEFIGDRSATAVVEELKAGVSQIKALRAEKAARAEAAQNYQATLDELTAEIEDAEDEIETEPELSAEDEPAADDEETDEEPSTTAEVETADEVVEPAEGEVVTAAARRLRRPPAPTPERTPTPERGLTVRASHGIEGFAPGQSLDRTGLAQALINAHRTTTVMQPGVRQNVTVASVEYPFPEDRVLTEDAASNSEKFKTLLNRPSNELQALIADGGFCAPFTPFYDSIVYATAARPVRDGLPSYSPARGGITYPPALSLADARDAITIWDADTDADPGTTTKACLVLECPEFLSAQIEAIAACVQLQNFTQMTWPERISELTELVAAAHAEAGEVELLDGLAAGSTQLTDAGVYGAVSSLLSAILNAAAGIRNRERMTRDRPMHVVLPMWTSDLLVQDIVNSNLEARYSRTQAGVTAMLQQYGVNVSWYMDSQTGGGMMFPTQSAGALQTFPNTVKWFIYPEGTWTFLDRGRLDLGIVRDSTLNATNTFQIWYETFEGIAKIGPTSYEVTSTVCPTGITGGTQNGSTIYSC